VDRSPTGSGVTARVAVQFAKGLIAKGQLRKFESVTRDVFTGEVVDTVQTGEFAGVVVQVGGRGYYSGRCEFTAEADDPLKEGFLLR